MKTNCRSNHFCSDDSGIGCDYFIVYHGLLYPSGRCRYSEIGYCRNCSAWPESISNKIQSELDVDKIRNMLNSGCDAS